MRTKLGPVEIKSPCPKLWQEMEGNRKTRFCDQCELHVHNLSAMSPDKVEQLIARGRNKRVCISYALRPDGKMMTQWDILRYALGRSLRRALAWVFAIFSPLAFSACETQDQAAKQTQLTGRIGPRCGSQQKSTNKSSEEPFPRLTGMVAPPPGPSR